MTFSLKHAVAVGALASFATGAWAFDVFVSSGTALRDTLGGAFSQYCDDGVKTIYQRTAAKGAPLTDPATANIRAYECTLSATNQELVNRGIAGQPITLYHSVEVNGALGGSILGVVPIYRGGDTADPVEIEYVDTTAETCADDTTTTFGGTAWTLRRCSNSIGRRSDFGVSDTEPTSFAGDNLPAAIAVDANNAAISSAERAAKWSEQVGANPNIVPAQLLADGFGLLVNNRTTPEPAGIGAVISSLTRAQIASLLSGRIDDWGMIDAALAGRPVTVCRRTKGSGTQASFNSFFNDNPYKSSGPLFGALPVQGAVTGGGPFGNLLVIESASSGGVRTCVAGDANAIGILTLEASGPLVPPTDTTFIAIDGVNPVEIGEASDSPDGIADNVREDRIINGSYPYFQESTIQWDAGNPRLVGADDNAYRLAFAELVRDTFGAPGITRNLTGVVSLAKFWAVSGGAPAGTCGGAFAGATPKPAPLPVDKCILHYTRGGNAGQNPVFSPF